jgi:hypothetical protein
MGKLKDKTRNMKFPKSFIAGQDIKLPLII